MRAERVTPDGICLDAEGAIWAASFGTDEVLRVHEGGMVTERIRVRTTPYDGVEVQGKVMMTLVRGTVVAEDGKPVGESGYGQFIPRLGIQSQREDPGL
ncbi:MAG: SMP-30/gluconolactonase/LRE family protein [Pseudomonadota bacterium]